jgi:WS/DGAT/MGAT family acyltransferase
MRERLVEPPLRLGHPVWVADPDFDLDRHVHRASVPGPGGRSEFADLVADITSRPIERDRPLWEWWFVDGLEHGYVANIWKVHHACIDGMSWAALEDVFYDHEPDPAPPATASPAGHWEAEAVPGRVPMLARSLLDFAATPVRLAQVAASGISAGGRLLRSRRNDQVVPPGLPPRAPKVSFNAHTSARRSWSFAGVPLADVKVVKNVFGVTVNDVALAMCAGALRHYLIERDELPDEPLTAMVPVGLRSHATPDAGNRVSAMIVSLATNVADPVERLHVIVRSTRSAKVLQDAIGPDIGLQLADVPPPALVRSGAALLEWSGLVSRLPPLTNLTISNVPGPTDPLYFCGGRLSAVYSTGVVADGLGLMIGLSSYCGQIDFGVTACADLVPEPQRIADGLVDELNALIEAAR